MRPVHALSALAVMFLWGVNFAVTKIGLQQLPPLTFMTLRVAMVAALLVPFVRMPAGRMKEIAALSFTFGFAHFAFMFTGLKFVDAAVASVAIQIQVPFAAILAALFFGDKLGWRRLTGMSIAILGVAILAGEPRAGSEIWAIGLIVVAALLWAVANIQMKRLSDVSGFALNAWIALLALPQLVLGSFLLESGQVEAVLAADWRAWAAVAYHAVIVVILCYGVWYWLLSRYQVNQTMPWTLLVPLFGIASGVMFLGEPFTWNLAVGSLGTIIGVAIILIRRPTTVDTKARGG
ncbi:MAG TPA: EamA family transporter [Alphaproteobacteria bacterium]|nr:EamA family transporter [Alphaproteobacteria bacterium]